MPMPSRQPAAQWLLLALLLFTVAGCHKKHVQAAPLPPPVETRSAPDAMPPPAVDESEAPKPTPELVIPPPRSAPRPPRRPTPTPAPEPEPETAEAKPAPPRIAPRLTPAEEDTYKEKTWQAILATERNLQALGGRQLSVAQQDIEGKVRGFLAQAREAIGVGDWVRALNLAEKALVLSRELATSF